MIDRFGNKLRNSPDEEIDLDFLKAEINFLLKGFQKDPTDTKARLMAIKGERLSASLDKSTGIRSDLRLLEQLITAMVDYCRNARDRDIPWYMGWLCRNLHYAGSTIASYTTGEMNYMDISCIFFEYYEQVEPTNQGRNILVNTYCIQANALMDAKDPQKDVQALAILEKAKACEQKIDPEYSRHNRFRVSEQLYVCLYDLHVRLKRSQDAFEALLQAIRCVKKANGIKQESRNMRNLARYCVLYTQHPLYEPEKDPIDLQSVILMLEQFHKKSLFSGIRTYLEQLGKFKKG